ncbi:MAG TPA: IclR family transcriptional regulator [Candidatus Limnocylindrales bacterium]|nr:IclR family transcriptional regulator [Candidatus Limnocylindrales bacterium]
MSRVQSIERAFAVLGALTDGPIGVTEVADRVDLPKSTAARMLASLAREGAVEQIPGDTRYRLGPRMESLATGLVANRSIAAIARPHLAELAAAIGEVAGLSVPEGDAMHYVDQVDSDHPVGVRDWTGSRIPLHGVSSGLAVLALRPTAEIERYLAGPLERFTERTMTDPDQLRARLRRVQLDGYAWTAGEYTEDIASVASAIADASGEVVAAIHVHGPSYRFPAPGREAELGLEVATAANRIARALRQGPS